jgi:hypothetical protein
MREGWAIITFSTGGLHRDVASGHWQLPFMNPEHLSLLAEIKARYNLTYLALNFKVVGRDVLAELVAEELDLLQRNWWRHRVLCVADWVSAEVVLVGKGKRSNV